MPLLSSRGYTGSIVVTVPGYREETLTPLRNQWRTGGGDEGPDSQLRFNIEPISYQDLKRWLTC